MSGAELPARAPAPSCRRRPGALLRSAALASCATLAALASSCDQYGGDPHAGYRSVTAADRSWRAYYLSPPWVVSSNDTTGATLRVPPVVGPPTDTGFDTVMSVNIRRSGAPSPEAAVSAWLNARRAEGYRVEYDARPTWVFAPSAALAPVDAGPMPSLGADAGATALPAVEAAATNGLGYERCVSVRLADGDPVVLLFRSVRSVADDPEVTAMIRLFEPRTPPAGMR